MIYKAKFNFTKGQKNKLHKRKVLYQVFQINE